MNGLNKERLSAVIRLLKVTVPEINGVIEYMEENGGWLPLQDDFVETLSSDGLHIWSQFYLDEKKIRALNALLFFDQNELQGIRDPDNFRIDFYQDLAAELESGIEFPVLTGEEKKDALEQFKKYSDSDKENISKQTCIFIWGFLTAFFNYFSLMVHGKSMCRLVEDAVNGDDQAYCLAVQIDRTVLTLPYFKKRMLKAQFNNNGAFLTALSYRLRNPILRGKIKYRSLWVTFAVLDDEGLLGLPHEQIMDICQEVGVYGKDFGIEDVGHLSKRLWEYRKSQRKPNIF